MINYALCVCGRRHGEPERDQNEILRVFCHFDFFVQHMCYIVKCIVVFIDLLTYLFMSHSDIMCEKNEQTSMSNTYRGIKRLLENVHKNNQTHTHQITH